MISGQIVGVILGQSNFRSGELGGLWSVQFRSPGQGGLKSVISGHAVGLGLV